MKVCTRCKEERDKSCYKQLQKSIGLQSICNVCLSDINKKRYEKFNPVIKNGLVYKKGTNLVIRVYPYGNNY